MDSKLLNQQNMGDLFAVTMNFLKFLQTKMGLDYDAEAGILYLHNEMRNDGIIYFCLLE